MDYSKQDYENEPVHYCANCLSLNVKELPGVMLDICGECGNTDINIADMEEWTQKYTAEYGESFMSEELDEIED
jgi:hypothetical protein